MNLERATCEASALEVLQAEMCRRFDPEVAESLGRDVGFRFVARLPAGPPPFGAPLDVLKFFCKEVWIELYGKKVDRLQTNHKGTFLCTDLHFVPLARLKRASQADLGKFLAFHKGMVRGGLDNLGVKVVDVSVQVLGNDESPALGCCFTVRTV